MKQTAMIPLESILKDVYYLVNNSDIREDLIMEFLIQGLEHLSVYKSYEHAVCILNVENHNAVVPNGMIAVEMAMYFNNVNSSTTHTILTNTTQLILGDLNNGIITDQQLNWDSNNSIVLENNLLTQSSRSVSTTTSSTQSLNLAFTELNRSHIITLKPTNFKSLSALSNRQSGWKYLGYNNNPLGYHMHCDGIDKSMFKPCGETYYVDHTGCKFITSFDSGYLMIAYYKYPQNDNGQFLVPDNPMLKEALQNYCLFRIFQVQWHMSTEGAERKFKYYSDEWVKTKQQAINDLMMPNLDDYKYVNDMIHTMFKDRNNYMRVFGGQGRERFNPK